MARVAAIPFAMQPGTLTRPLCALRYYTTLHGFEYGGNDDGTDVWYVACLYTKPAKEIFDRATNTYKPNEAKRYKREEFLREVLKRCGMWDGAGEPPRDRLRLDSFVNADFIEVRRRGEAPAVINAVLSLGYSAQPKSLPMVTFEPSDAPYTIEKAEHILLARYIRTMLRPGVHVSQFVDIFTDKILDERLWKTPEGKRFARAALAQEPWLAKELPERLLVRDDPRHPFDPSVDWPPPVEDEAASCGKEPPAAPRVPAAAAAPRDAPNEKKRPADAFSSSEEDEPQTCVVCDERPADTRVLPCNHRVACRVCSDKLKTTPNARLCIVCRQEITEVIVVEKSG